MKKIWGYISAILGGIVIGMIAMFQMAKGSISTTEIKTRSIKQKNTANSTQDVSSAIETGKSTRRKRKRLKKANNN